MADYVARFPLSGNASRLGAVRVNDVGDARNGNLVIGGHEVMRQHLEEDVRCLIHAARQTDPDPLLQSHRVIVDLEDVGDITVTGLSYGLALALADLIARRAHEFIPGDARVEASARVPVVAATGTLLNGKGEIGSISDLEQKVALIADAFARGDLKAGDAFLFPTANREGLSRDTSAAIERLEDQGLRCAAVANLAQARAVVEGVFIGGSPKPPTPQEAPTRWQMSARLAAIATVLAVLALSVICIMTCEFGPEPPYTIAINAPEQPDSDLVINLREGGTDGRARPFPPAAIPKLQTGDRYSINIKANRDIYLYIVQFDAAGNIRMLLTEDREGDFRQESDRNRLRNGDQLQLPGPHRHYRLDDVVGNETFHIIASARPIQNLWRQYKAAIGSASDQARATFVGTMRGSNPVDNPRPSPTSQAPDCTGQQHGAEIGWNDCDLPYQAAIGDRVTCLPGNPICRAVIVIDHLPSASAASGE